MSVKVPNYVLTEEIVCAKNGDKILPSGSFVKPIDIRYVPVHIKDANSSIWYDKNTNIFCYCHYGIVLIPLKSIREIS